MKLNVKARNVLTFALLKEKFNEICMLKSTKEMWDPLKNNYIENIDD